MLLLQRPEPEREVRIAAVFAVPAARPGPDRAERAYPAQQHVDQCNNCKLQQRGEQKYRALPRAGMDQNQQAADKTHGQAKTAGYANHIALHQAVAIK